MWPNDFFPQDWYTDDWWPEGPTAPPSGKGPKIGASRYDIAAYVQQMYAEEMRAQAMEDQRQAALLFQRAMRKAEWDVTLEEVQRRQTEWSMYTVLLAEL